MRFECTVQVGGDEHDVLVSSSKPLRLGQVWARLLCLLDAPAGLRPAIDPGAVLGSRQLPTGSVIRASVDGGTDSRARGATGLAVHVIGGSDAGRIAALRTGPLRIGRDPHCGIVLHDDRVSRRHVSVRADARGVTLRDETSTNGTTVETVEVGPRGAPLPIGATVRIGDTLLTVRDGDEPALPVTSSGGRWHVAHVPRPRDPPPAVLELAGRPPRPHPRPTQWLAALIPAVAGGGLAWLAHSPTFLLFALLSPVMLLGTALGDRLHGRRSRRRTDAGRTARAAADELAIETALRVETAARRSRYPDPALVGRAASVPTTRLWQRRPPDDDVLVLRFGSGETAADTRLQRDGVTEPAGRLFAVPLTVDLRDGPVGFAGPPELLDGLACCLVAQLAVLHPPGAVELALFLSDGAGEARWSWARWLPHLGDRVARAAQQWAGLADRLPHRSPHDGRWVVAVVDRAAGPASAATLADLFARRGGADVTALAFGGAVTDLPAWCARTVNLCAPAGGAVFDRVGPAWAEQVARALAPFRDSDGGGGATGPPDRCHLLDVLDFEGPSCDEVMQRWAASGGRADTVLGMTAGGRLELDLQRDGPHLLVAGTTGSGKSELLRALVLGLALQHPPDELTFVLVDYKGGAAFADCSALPHTVGAVTDLDPHLTRRALRSLEAELRRRERLFAAAGASDVDAYRRASAPPLARLVIVVDEFAALADTLPDFLHGLVSVARRGRSLGVHLVLATQRPGVAVTPEIRANTGCRIALRVVEGAESTDVIGVPHAADLPARLPGRALITGDGGPVEFQSAGVDGVVRERPDEVTVARLGPWRDHPALPSLVTAPSSVRILDAVRLAAARQGVCPAAGPWLDPLPERLAGDALAPAAPDRVPLGLLDLPGEQRQDTLELDLRVPSSWLILGGPRSGRTTALLGVALASADALPPSELEIYVIDGGGVLAATLRGLPHVATCLGPAELTAAGQLVRRMASRPPGPVRVLLLLDHGERVLICDEDSAATACAVELAAVLGRRRATVVTAGSRALLGTRVTGGFEHRLLLALPDRADYALAGIPSRDVPASMPPGRALRVGDGAELQIAVRGGSAQGTAAVVRALATRWGGARSAGAVRVRPLPDALDLLSLPPHPTRLRFGVAGEAADPVLVDPFGGTRRWLIAGPARSGRTTALRTLLADACRAGVPVLVAAGSRSELSAGALERGVPVLAPSGTAGFDPPVDPTLVLIDDVESFAGSPVDEMLAAWARDVDTLSFVVAVRSDELAAAYRGLAAEVRRARSGVLLRPSPLDGELFDVRLPRAVDTPPGRGVLIGATGWYVGSLPAPVDAPVPVQVAQP